MGKKKSKKKLFIILGVVILVAVLVAVNMNQGKRGLITVQTKKVFTTDVTSIVSGSGRIQPKTKVNIVSEASAEVISLPVKEGDWVNKGQILIQLDTIQLKSDMESALYSANETEARLDGAQILLDQRREEYNRQMELYNKKLTSEQAYKDAHYAFRNQEAGYKAMVEQKRAASSRLEKARDLLNKTTIESPMDGVVTWVDVEVGEIAQAQTPYSQGRTLMIVADLSEFEVEVEIDETDIADLAVGQKSGVEIDAFPDTTFDGEVIEIGNTATITGLGSNDQQINFKVKVTLLDVYGKIKPGMSATVDITTNEHNDVLATLIQAIVMRGPEKDSTEVDSDENVDDDGNVAVASTVDEVEEADEGDEAEEEEDRKGVFVNRDGVAEFVEVETGIADRQNIEIISGLQEDDEIITGSFRILRTIKNGDEIEVDNSKAKKEDGR
ncbi:MAG: efflux RND transporter periplasmic adaptor subunit [FCB group bacterium]|nr:efflux RND transporter periplasmic adaptor subunit [FCB group bacterium]